MFEHEPSPTGLVLLGSTACPSVGLDPRYLYCFSRYMENEKTHPCSAMGKAPKLFFRVSEWVTC